VIARLHPGTRNAGVTTPYPAGGVFGRGLRAGAAFRAGLAFRFDFAAALLRGLAFAFFLAAIWKPPGSRRVPARRFEIGAREPARAGCRSARV